MTFVPLLVDDGFKIASPTTFFRHRQTPEWINRSSVTFLTAINANTLVGFKGAVAKDKLFNIYLSPFWHLEPIIYLNITFALFSKRTKRKIQNGINLSSKVVFQSPKNLKL
jgi:hypothetical protein